jgi:hypothetical protein
VIAWLTQSVLFLLLGFAGIIGIVIIFRSPRGGSPQRGRVDDV